MTSASLTPSLGLYHSRFIKIPCGTLSRLVGGMRTLEANAKATISFSAPYLVDHPINLHRNDEVGIVHRLQGGKELLEEDGQPQGPAETSLPSQGTPPQVQGRGLLGSTYLEGAVHQSLIQVDDHTDLV